MTLNDTELKKLASELMGQLQHAQSSAYAELTDIVSRAKRRTPGLLEQPYLNQSMQVSIATTSTQSSPVSVFSDTSGPNGSILYGLALVYDVNTLQNYNFKVLIGGINQPGNKFAPLPTNTYAYDPVKTATAWLIQPKQSITVEAYNANSASTAGNMSVVEILDNL